VSDDRVVNGIYKWNLATTTEVQLMSKINRHFTIDEHKRFIRMVLEHRKEIPDED